MIDHSGHPHPSTPAARALCRANGGTGDITKKPKTEKKPAAAVRTKSPVQKNAPALTEARVPVVPRKKLAPLDVPVRKAPPTDPAERIKFDRAAKRQHRKVKPVTGRNDVKGIIEKVSKSVSQAEVSSNYIKGDVELTAIAKEQGWLGKPGVVTTEQMDSLIAQGAQPLYRGMKSTKDIRATDFLDSLRGQPGDTVPEFLIGTGIYGNGIYFSDKRDTAENFAINRFSKNPDSGIVRAVIDPSARVIDYEDAKAGAYQAVKDLDNDPAFQSAEHGSPEWMNNRRRMGIASDPGRWAAASGYDVIQVDNEHDGLQVTRQMVVLNRTVLILEDSP